jgi:hypothetical protein
MKPDDLRMKIEKGLSQGLGYHDIYVALQSFAASGGSAEEAQSVLKSIRKSIIDDQQDDLLLDALDCVAGDCLPQYRIWPRAE